MIDKDSIQNRFLKTINRCKNPIENWAEEEIPMDNSMSKCQILKVFNISSIQGNTKLNL